MDTLAAEAASTLTGIGALAFLLAASVLGLAALFAYDRGMKPAAIALGVVLVLLVAAVAAAQEPASAPYLGEHAEAASAAFSVVERHAPVLLTIVLVTSGLLLGGLVLGYLAHWHAVRAPLDDLRTLVARILDRNRPE